MTICGHIEGSIHTCNIYCGTSRTFSAIFGYVKRDILVIYVQTVPIFPCKITKLPHNIRAIRIAIIQSHLLFTPAFEKSALNLLGHLVAPNFRADFTEPGRKQPEGCSEPVWKLEYLSGTHVKLPQRDLGHDIIIIEPNFRTQL